MDILPKDLENIIEDYKYNIETTENYDKVMKEFKNLFEIEVNNISSTRVVRIVKFYSYNYRFSTFCNKCGNFGDIAEAIYANQGFIRTLKQCNLNEPIKLQYFHRITSRYYKLLPDKKFCYCVSNNNEEIRNILL